MFKSTKALLLLLSLSLGGSLAQAATSAQEVQELLSTIDAGMFPATAAASMKMTSYKDGNPYKEIAMDLVMKDDKGLIGINAPAIDKGKYILKSGKNLWMYFSDIKRSIRVSARDSFMGTDASNYDILQLNLLGDYQVQSFAEDTLDGRPVIRVELAALPGTEGYERIVSWIDPAQRRLIRNDCYSISGALIKTIEYRNKTEMGDYRVPRMVYIVNHVDQGRSSSIEIVSVEPKDDIRNSVFTLGYLESLQ